MKYSICLLLTASQMLAGCTPMVIVRSAAWSIGAPAQAADVDPDELYWSPAVISNENCPEINGKFLFPKGQNAYGVFFSSDVDSIRMRKEEKKVVLFDVAVSIKSSAEGIKSRAQSDAGDVTDQRTFDKRFGCANGEYVVRGWGAYTGGGDTFTCTALSYSESHWKIDQEKNLVVNRTQRNPCWLDRGKRDPSRERVLPARVYKRIGDAALD